MTAFQILSAISLGFGFALVGWITVSETRQAREDAADDFAHGDHPHLPRQLIRLGSFHADGDTL